MKKKILNSPGFVILFAVMISGYSEKVKAQELDFGSDIVSSYIWRGQYLGGVSIQPSLEFSKGGFIVGAWSSVDLQEKDNTEFDIYASFGLSDFTVSLTDYSFHWSTVPYFENWKSNHSAELLFEYDFSDILPLVVKWGTYIFNDEDFSSYAEVAWSFNAGKNNCTLSAGLTPWSGYYADRFSLVNIDFKVSKDIMIGDFVLPVFGSLTINPVKADIPKLFNQDGVWLVFGLSL